MAAYAALFTVMNIIETIQNHPRPPISFDKEQLQSLTENITFLQEFLETHSVDDDDLEGRIADAAYAAEDVIESYIVDQIEASTIDHEETISSSNSDGETIGSAYSEVRARLDKFFKKEFLETHSVDDDDLEGRIAGAAYAAEDAIESYIVDRIEASKTMSSADFYDGLRKVIQDLDLILRDMPSSAKKTGMKDDDDDQLLHNNYSLRRSDSSTGHDTAVGLDDATVEIMNRLTWNQSNRQIIPIVGMGGIGKTTLANNIYVKPVIVEHFDLRGWATISQEYNLKEILLEVLHCFNTLGSREKLRQMSEDELGNKLYKSLFGRRYLIVLDDIWSIETWDKVKTFFPDNKDGSAIMLTTRLSNLAFLLGGYCCHEMSFLNEYQSWNLFCKSTFREESCPCELEEIGKKIVENCKGLPLSIVVVGGLLAKAKRTREYWLYIAANLNSTVNLENNEACLKILHLSYKVLPIYLKPCFLYMGVYPEDCEIHVPELMKLWVAEGFLKPVRGKCLEIVAEEYFGELVDRNLIIRLNDHYGEPSGYKVHDLLLDVCLREAQKYKFLCVVTHHNFNPQDLNTQRRIVVHDSTMAGVINAWLSHHRTLVRSLILTNFLGFLGSFPKPFNSKLLRVLSIWNDFASGVKGPVLESTHRIVNCRYISGVDFPNPKFLSSNPGGMSLFCLCLLWNVQTLILGVVEKYDIWKMSQLRHVRSRPFARNFYLLDPPPDEDDFVLGNLLTLMDVTNLKFSKDVVKRLPNIKTLEVSYKGIVDPSSCCLNNLVQLINLESLDFRVSKVSKYFWVRGLESLSFPRSLRELTLEGTRILWDDVGTKIGRLPHLQVLELREEACGGLGGEWETVEGQFRSLKYLTMWDVKLEYWRTESCTHFPCLEHLSLYGLLELKEIPSEIGEPLKSIHMWRCSDSAIFSAKEILNEQESLGNEGLQVIVDLFWQKNPYVQSLAAPNFRVEVKY